MLQFLFLLVCLGLLAVAYRGLSRSAKSATRDSVNSCDMVQLTSTNNSYPPIGDVLASLDDSESLNILGGELRADVRGYMDGERKEG